MPAPLGEAAYYGLAGEFTRLVGPETEADPAALLLQFLAAIGSIIGRGPHYRVGAAIHFANLFMVVVGNSAKARKGTSWSEVHAACELIDLRWIKTRLTSGLSTGEGLIHAVRGEIKELVPIKEKQRIVDHHIVKERCSSGVITNVVLEACAINLSQNISKPSWSAVMCASNEGISIKSTLVS